MTTESFGWAHSCCSRSALESALINPEISSIESDIVFSQTKQAPCMAHPPLSDSDFSFDDFFAAACSRDVKVPRKHLKLDFKDAACVDPCLVTVAATNPDPKIQTIYLNADILPGPGVPASAVVIPADFFVQRCSNLFPVGILSLGWKMDLSLPATCYLDEHCSAMEDLIRRYRLSESRVVLAVAARPLSRQPEAMVALLHRLDKAELLVWTGTGEAPIDPSVVSEIREAFKGIDSRRVKFDVQIFKIK